MDRQTFRSIVDAARYAPSAHNTQPARWSLCEDGSILISADLSRRLPVADPKDRDLLVACGAAIEGTVLAFAQHDLGAQVEVLARADQEGHRPIAVVRTDGKPRAEDVARAAFVMQRRTHRGGFGPSTSVDLGSLAKHGVTVVQDKSEIGWLSTEIDRASARILRDPAMRAELLDWMRLSPSDMYYDTDGLNREALAMDRLTAMFTKPVLGSKLYLLLSTIGLGPALSGEATRSRTSTAISLFHWPQDGCMIAAGRAFYRTWLDAAAIGLAGWPAAALADDEQTAALIRDRFDIPDGEVLYNALRLGIARGATPPNTRLDIEALIVAAAHQSV